MGLVLAVLFLVLGATTSLWWLLPAGVTIFARKDKYFVSWWIASVVAALALTVSPLWWMAMIFAVIAMNTAD